MIYNDGRVVYRGHMNVKVKGVKKYKIPKYKVQELLKEFDNAGYFQLNDSYDSLVTDVPACITSVSLNGIKKGCIMA